MNEGQFISEMTALGASLRDLIETASGPSLVYGTVSTVDTDNNTINVRMGDDGLVISGISLSVVSGGNTSVLCYPPIGSLVVLGIPHKQPENAFVVQFTAIDRWVIRQSFENEEDSVEASADAILIKRGDYSCIIDKEKLSLSCTDGGSIEISGNKVVVNGGNLGGLAKIEDLTNALNRLVQFANGHTHPYTDTTPSGVITSMTMGPTQQFTPFQRAEYENTDVTQ